VRLLSVAIGVAGALMFTLAPAVEPVPASRHVLLLHQAGVAAPIRARFNAAFVEQLRGAAFPIDLYEETIEADRFPGAAQSAIVTDYLRRKYADTRIDAIVTQGVIPLSFVRRNRALFNGAPIVAVASPAGSVAGSADDVTGLQGGYFIEGTLDLALTLCPDTRRVYVIDGAAGNTGELQAEVERQFKGRPIELVYLRDLPLTELVRRVAAVPPRSVVFFLRQMLGTETQSADPVHALARVTAVSPVPVFSQLEEFMGRGIVGGYIWRFETDARRMADMAAKIAGGARPQDIAVDRVTYGTLLDWQQLQRWKIPASRIPHDAIVLFRTPTFFEQYRGYVVTGGIVFALQLGLIVVLMIERESRRRAEADASRTRESLSHLTRVSAMGQLTASLAHELNQPLTGILCNARAARNLLSRGPVPASEISDILDAIVDEDKRAADVIGRIRDLVTKRTTERAPLDMNEVVERVTNLVRRDSAVRQVSIRAQPAPGGAPVTGDRVQLQQVILNLLLNAIEASSSSSSRLPHEVAVSFDTTEPRGVHLVVRDSGSGLPAGAETRIFEPFYTTKASGMGMGLSIAQSIVEAHGGRIWAAPAGTRGAEFHVTLPRLDRSTAPR
jgi:signal transduction histidine kinase